MNTETALPEAEISAGAGDQPEAAPVEQEGQQTEAESKEEAKEEKPEKHPLEKELAKERRRINRIVEQREQARAQLSELQRQLEQYQKALPKGEESDTTPNDDVVRIPRAELPKFVERIQGEAAQRGELAKAADNMRKALGADFQAVTDELAEVLPVADLQFAVAASEAPAELARYLIDPDNADEAERIARMSPYQAGRALAKIEAKLTEAKAKPQPSKAARPLEPVKGGGAVSDPDTSKWTDAQWLEHRRKQRP